MLKPSNSSSLQFDRNLCTKIVFTLLLRGEVGRINILTFIKVLILYIQAYSYIILSAKVREGNHGLNNK